MSSRIVVALITTVFVPFLSIFLSVAFGFLLLPVCNVSGSKAFCEFVFGDQFYTWSRIFFIGLSVTFALLAWRWAVPALRMIPKTGYVLLGFLLGYVVWAGVVPIWWPV